MSNTSFSFYSNIFGFIVGGVSLLGFVVRLCRTHLPSNKIKTLEALLHETENTFRSAVEDGLLVDEFVQMAQNRLALLKEETCSLRSRAYNATSLRLDYAEFVSGTSTAIGRTCQSLEKLKAEVITSSNENHGLMQTNPISRTPPVLTQTESEEPLTPPPPAEIVRPPPALHAWRPCDVHIVFVESNLFGGFPQSGSDVRTVDVHT